MRFPAADRLRARLLFALLTGLAAACSASARAEAPVIIITATPSRTPPPASAPAAAASATPTFAPFATARSTATPTALPACPVKQGDVSRDKLSSQALDGQTIPFRLYLPPCYSLHASRRFPVLYLLHGLNMNEDTWVELGAAAAADDLIARGETPPFIIVMPRAPDDVRFTETVAFDLVPYIDAHYRTFPDRSYRALGGMSRGGGWAVRIGFQYPYLFGSLGLHSLAVRLADEDKLTGWLNRLPDDKLPRIYMDIGRSDSLLKSAAWLDAALTTRYVTHEWHVNPGNHDLKYWQTHLPDYLRWYTATWSGAGD